eukprot:TRINITY_DN10361_c0_g1_i1.p1 TRINITY_DN10361_c0_g1~~TRINITY_DN10361_c0_g1_i1.p1  ORF type:complete len:400 (-),score=-37.42 TRINITY_DN10361_c0_g1_i1:416-1507(-)
MTMASRHSVVVAKRAEALHDDMVCPIPAVNWKEARTEAPVTGRDPNSEVCPIAPKVWRSGSNTSQSSPFEIPGGFAAGARGGGSPLSSSASDRPPAVSPFVSNAPSASTFSRSSSLASDGDDSPDSPIPPSRAFTASGGRAASASGGPAAPPARSFSGEMSGVAAGKQRGGIPSGNPMRRRMSESSSPYSSPIMLTSSAMTDSPGAGRSSSRMLNPSPAGVVRHDQIGGSARISAGLRGEADVGSKSATAIACTNWNDVDTICTSMDAAGIRIDQIDLTTLSVDDDVASLADGPSSPTESVHSCAPLAAAAGTAGLSMLYAPYPAAAGGVGEAARSRGSDRPVRPDTQRRSMDGPRMPLMARD